MIADVMRARMTGTPWAGLDVKPGPVLLVTEEGPMPTAYHWWRAHEMGVMFRYEALDAWAAENADPPDPYMPREVRQRSDEYHSFGAWLQRRLHEWCEGQRNALIIVDTLATWSDVADENDARQMTAAISSWCRFAQETGACVLLIHHTRKGAASMGGHSGKLGHPRDGRWIVVDSPRWG